jgi:hypothetical protein
MARSGKARGGAGLGQKNKNRAAGAQLCLAKHGRACSGAEGSLLGLGMLGLRCWESAALVCNPLVPGLRFFYAPHLFTVVPSH